MKCFSVVAFSLKTISHLLHYCYYRAGLLLIGIQVRRRSVLINIGPMSTCHKFESGESRCHIDRRGRRIKRYKDYKEVLLLLLVPLDQHRDKK